MHGNISFSTYSYLKLFIIKFYCLGMARKLQVHYFFLLKFSKICEKWRVLPKVKKNIYSESQFLGRNMFFESSLQNFRVVGQVFESRVRRHMLSCLSQDRFSLVYFWSVINYNKITMMNFRFFFIFFIVFKKYTRFDYHCCIWGIGTAPGIFRLGGLIFKIINSG